jgi:hypothetical protein
LAKYDAKLRHPTAPSNPVHFSATCTPEPCHAPVPSSEENFWSSESKTSEGGAFWANGSARAKRKTTAKGKCWNVAKCKDRSHLEFSGIEALDVCSLVVPGAPCLKLFKCAIQTFLYGTPFVIKHTHATQGKQRAHPQVTSHAKIEVV